MNKIRVCMYCKRARSEVRIFHRFPTDPIRAQQWLDALGVDYKNQVHTDWNICNFHFNDNQYKSFTKLRLKKNALPAPNGPCLWWSKQRTSIEVPPDPDNEENGVLNDPSSSLSDSQDPLREDSDHFENEDSNQSSLTLTESQDPLRDVDENSIESTISLTDPEQFEWKSTDDETLSNQPTSFQFLQDLLNIKKEIAPEEPSNLPIGFISVEDKNEPHKMTPVKSIKILNETGLMDVCRICSKPVEISAIDVPTLLEKLQFVIPELNLEIYPNPSICEGCFPTLNDSYNLKKLSLSTETLLIKAITTRPINEENVIMFPPSEFTQDEAPPTNQNENEPTKCHICEKTFDDLLTLNEHIMSHEQTIKVEKDENLNNSDAEVTCNKCHKVYSNPRSLARHKSLVHKPPNERYKNCEICGQRVTKACLKRHTLLHFPELNQLECPTCKKLFATKPLLNTHVNHHCMGRKGCKGIKCKMCNSTFASRILMKEHLSKEHTIVVNTHCEQCNMNFSNALTYKSHLKSKRHALKLVISHRPKDKVSVTECHLCDKKFPYPFALRQHLAYAHEEKKMKCEVCGKHFSYRISLERHWVKVHDMRGDYECSKCKSVYFTENSLKYHFIKKHGNSILNQMGSEQSSIKSEEEQELNTV